MGFLRMFGSCDSTSRPEATSLAMYLSTMAGLFCTELKLPGAARRGWSGLKPILNLDDKPHLIN